MGKDDFTGLVIIALIIVVLYGGQQGWFNNILTINLGVGTGTGGGIVNSTTITILNNQTTSGICTLNIPKVTVCPGELVTGTISGKPNDACNLYYNPPNADWTLLRQPFMLDSNGFFTASTPAPAVTGEYLFRALCSNSCLTNLDAVTVVTCNQPTPEPTITPPEPVTCTDTDGGNYPDTPGICTDSTGSYSDLCFSYSNGDTGVAEHYCSAGICVGTSHKCSITAIQRVCWDYGTPGYCKILG